MVEAIKRTIQNHSVGARFIGAILAMGGVMATHEGTIPGYTPGVYIVSAGERVMIMAGYWEEGPVLVAIALGIAIVGLTTLADWGKKGAPPPTN